MSKNESQNQHSDLYYQLLKLYSSEFIDECNEIINQRESDFLHRFFNKMNLIIQQDFGEDIIEEITFVTTIKEIERRIYESFYQPMKSSCLTGLTNYTKQSSNNNKRQTDSSFLQNFRSHCSFNLVPIHTCKGRFIPIYDTKGKIAYVICVNCKCCFYESSIIMYCNNCKMTFYSNIISSTDKLLPPATWDKYHCNAIMNEQMKCIKCQELFYYKNGSLVCKGCKFITNPLDVVWRCVVCKKEFKSYAKIYNPLEFKLVKNAIRNALLYKVNVKPMELPCNCDSNPIGLTYSHKAQCKGLLYHGMINGKNIIVCSKCKVMASSNKFKWECPICLKMFTSKNIKIIENEESNSLLMREITKQIKGEINSNNNGKNNEQTIKKLSQQITNAQKKDQNETENIYSSGNSKGDGFKLHYRNNNHNNDLNNMLSPSKDNSKDCLRQRNLSINLGERSGSKKRDNLTTTATNKKIINYEDDDDDPYYSSNKSHLNKMEEKNNHSNNHSHSQSDKHHPYQKRCISFNDNQSYTNERDPDSKSNNNQKNYKIYIPQRTIDLNPDIDQICPFNSFSNLKSNSTDESNKNYKQLSSTGNRFNLQNYNIDNSPVTLSKFAIVDNRNSFKLVNRENDTLKEEVMGYNRRTHEKKKNNDMTPIIANHGEHKSMLINETPVTHTSTAFNANISGGNDGLNKGSSNMNYLKQSPRIAQNRLSGESNIAVNLEHYLNSPYIDNKMSSNPSSPYNNSSMIFTTPQVDQEPEKNTEQTNPINQTNLTLINIDDYSIVTQLGQGTFGKIYLVNDKNSTNIYSLKKIVLTEELDLESILKEYQLVHTLQHSNIIKIIGYNQARLDFATFVIYILMEVGLGDWEKEIRTHIDKRQYYTEKEIWSILKQLTSALSFLQKENVSHRDIKPGNVLVFKNSVYKIADFGEAKQVTKNHQTKQANTLRGTELYMSPLLFNGIKTNQLDIKHNLYKSDVFSLGLCMVFAMSLTTNTIMEIRKMVDVKYIRNYLKLFFKERYSMKLLDLIGDMLEINEKSRVDFVELEKKLENA